MSRYEKSAVPNLEISRYEKSAFPNLEIPRYEKSAFPNLEIPRYGKSAFPNLEIPRYEKVCISQLDENENLLIWPPPPGGARPALGPRASLGLVGWKIEITPDHTVPYRILYCNILYSIIYITV